MGSNGSDWNCGRSPLSALKTGWNSSVEFLGYPCVWWYHAAFQHEVIFNFWHCTNSQYLNTNTPMIMDFHLSIYNHHHTANIIQPSIMIPYPDTNKSVFNNPSDIEIEVLPANPSHTLWSNNQYNHSSQCNQPFDMSSASSSHFLLFLRLHITTTPSFPLLLSTHSFLHIYNPRNLIIWEKVLQRWEWEWDLWE